MASCLRNSVLSHSPPSFLNSPSPICNPMKTSPAPRIPTTHLRISSRNRTPIEKTPSFVNRSSTHFLNSRQCHFSALGVRATLQNFSRRYLPLSSLAIFFSSFPSSAAEVEQASNKINLEAIVLAIDDFNNRNPFFVAGLTFIWLVVIPLTQEYLKKFKFISAIDAFRKLRDDPSSQLLDIRRKQSLRYLSSPNLKILQKSALQVDFSGLEEEEFVKEVLSYFPEPGNTVLCILDNFDGDSLMVAELLCKNGFKEVYAIKGGLRGKDGWQVIQDELLPPSTHVYPKKKGKTLSNVDINVNNPNGQLHTSEAIHQESKKDVPSEN